MAASVPRETLAGLVVAYGLPERAADQLAALLEALAAEPDPHTTVHRLEEAVEIHVADSLSGLEAPPLRSAGRIADLGAGAGFPGLVLAVARPEAQIDLVESATRKAAVIERLAAAGKVWNARAVAERAETWAGSEGREAYGAVTARALAPLAVLAEYAAPLLALGGALVAWKGRRDRDEEAQGDRAAAQLGLSPAQILAVMPFASARDRHLHVFHKVAPTPAGFPRRPGMARKKPLT